MVSTYINKTPAPLTPLLCAAMIFIVVMPVVANEGPGGGSGGHDGGGTPHPTIPTPSALASSTPVPQSYAPTTTINTTNHTTGYNTTSIYSNVTTCMTELHVLSNPYSTLSASNLLGAVPTSSSVLGGNLVAIAYALPGVQDRIGLLFGNATRGNWVDLIYHNSQNDVNSGMSTDPIDAVAILHDLNGEFYGSVHNESFVTFQDGVLFLTSIYSTAFTGGGSIYDFSVESLFDTTSSSDGERFGTGNQQFGSRNIQMASVPSLGGLLIADTWNHCIRYFPVFSFASIGSYATSRIYYSRIFDVTEECGDDAASAADDGFEFPVSVAVLDDRSYSSVVAFVWDYGNDRLKKIVLHPSQVTIPDTSGMIYSVAVESQTVVYDYMPASDGGAELGEDPNLFIPYVANLVISVKQPPTATNAAGATTGSTTILVGTGCSVFLLEGENEADGVEYDRQTLIEEGEGEESTAWSQCSGVRPAFFGDDHHQSLALFVKTTTYNIGRNITNCLDFEGPLNASLSHHNSSTPPPTAHPTFPPTDYPSGSPSPSSYSPQEPSTDPNCMGPSERLSNAQSVLAASGLSPHATSTSSSSMDGFVAIGFSDGTKNALLLGNFSTTKETQWVDVLKELYPVYHGSEGYSNATVDAVAVGRDPGSIHDATAVALVTYQNACIYSILFSGSTPGVSYPFFIFCSPRENPYGYGPRKFGGRNIQMALVPAARGILIADTMNNCIRFISLFSPNQDHETRGIEDVAGNCSADGSYAADSFLKPVSITLDPKAGAVFAAYVWDYGNMRLKKLDLSVFTNANNRETIGLGQQQVLFASMPFSYSLAYSSDHIQYEPIFASLVIALATSSGHDSTTSPPAFLANSPCSVELVSLSSPYSSTFSSSTIIRDYTAFDSDWSSCKNIRSNFYKADYYQRILFTNEAPYVGRNISQCSETSSPPGSSLSPMTFAPDWPTDGTTPTTYTDSSSTSTPIDTPNPTDIPTDSSYPPTRTIAVEPTTGNFTETPSTTGPTSTPQPTLPPRTGSPTDDVGGTTPPPPLFTTPPPSDAPTPTDPWTDEPWTPPTTPSPGDGRGETPGNATDDTTTANNLSSTELSIIIAVVIVGFVVVVVVIVFVVKTKKARRREALDGSGIENSDVGTTANKLRRYAAKYEDKEMTAVQVADEDGNKVPRPGFESVAGNANPTRGPETLQRDFEMLTVTGPDDNDRSTLDKGPPPVLKPTPLSASAATAAPSGSGGGGGPMLTTRSDTSQNSRSPISSLLNTGNLPGARSSSSVNNNNVSTELRSPVFVKQPQQPFPNNGSITMSGSQMSALDATTRQADQILHSIENDEVIRVKMLGRGAFGSVYSCVAGEGAIIAVKEMLLPEALDRSHSFVADVHREMDLVSKIEHPNVIRYYGCKFDHEESKLLLYMELASGGSLATLCRNAKKELPETTAKVYLRQVLEGLAHIHSKGVVHRDLKCDNVLLTTDGQCKLCDFGTSKFMSTTSGATKAAQTMIGTPLFMAPEMLLDGAVEEDEDEADGNAGGTTESSESQHQQQNGGYTKKADIWSFGIMALELLNRGNPPWPNFTNQGAALMHIASNRGKPRVPERLSPEFKDFIGKACDRNPTTRLTAAELLHHPWLLPTLSVSHMGALDDSQNARSMTPPATKPSAVLEEHRRQDIQPAVDESGGSPLVPASNTPRPSSTPQPVALGSDNYGPPVESGVFVDIGDICLEGDDG